VEVAAGCRMRWSSFATKVESHAKYEEFRSPTTSMERRDELTRVMTEMSDRIPVPKGPIP
jgi:hypothetical protein